MKKKIFGGLAMFAFTAVTILNLNLSFNTDKSLDVKLGSIEASAQSELSFNPGWWYCPGMGMTCPSNSYGQIQYNPDWRN